MVTVLVPNPEDVLQPYTAERQAAAAAGAEFVLGDDRPLPNQDAEVILASGLPLTAEVLADLTRCQLIVNYGIGYDSIDIEAATQLGIIVANTPSYGVAEVSDHTVGLILAITRRIPWLDRQVRAGQWSTAQQAIFEVRRVSAKTLGIIGLGKIGRQVARKMAVFDLPILAYDPFLTADTIRTWGATPTTFEILLSQSDIVTLHVPLTAKTRHLIDERALALMKPGATLINTSRGRVVDQAALIRALQANQIYAAALDVYYDEPLDPTNPLLALEPQRVILTPHFAGASVDALADQQKEVAAAIAAFLKGHWPEATVNPAVNPKQPLQPSGNW
jgi:D-3-phosphoglycerate dehydrogenase